MISMRLPNQSQVDNSHTYHLAKALNIHEGGGMDIRKYLFKSVKWQIEVSGCVLKSGEKIKCLKLFR